MRVEPLDSPLKGHQPLYVFNFLFLILNIWYEFKVLSRFMQKWIQPPACLDHGLHRILSSYWLAHFHLMKNPRKCSSILVWIAEWWNFYLRAAIQRTIDTNFRSTVRRKRSWFEHMQTVNWTSRRIRDLFAKSGSELWSCFKYSRSKLKN